MATMHVVSSPCESGTFDDVIGESGIIDDVIRESGIIDDVIDQEEAEQLTGTMRLAVVSVSLKEPIVRWRSGVFALQSIV